MSISMLGLFAVVAFGLSAWMTSRFCRPESRFYILDHPNERSLHVRPTPRTGGIAIVVASAVVGITAAFFFAPVSSHLGWFLGSALAVAAVSFIDDRVGLSSGRRIIVHFVAASVLIWQGFTFNNIPILGMPVVVGPLAGALIAILYVVWMINLYNFMDGMDGFAGGMAVIGFGTFVGLGLWEGQWLFAALNIVVAAAALGFLVFNFPPARIFMGDTGSSTLGLLAAGFSLWGAREKIFPFWVALIAFSPFIVDATVTLMRRIIRRERIWQAHRSHYYQRLVQLGWGHRKTVMWEYALMFGCSVTVFACKNAMPVVQYSVVGLWMAIYILLAIWVWRMERERNGSMMSPQKEHRSN